MDLPLSEPLVKDELSNVPEPESLPVPEPDKEPVASDPDPVADPEPPLKLGPGEKKSDDELRAEAATLLFASSDPLTDHRLTVLLERPQMARVKAVLEALQAELEAAPLPVVLRKIAGGWRLLTDPAQGEVIARLKKEPKAERISAAALESLAIVAYRQPVTKAEIEAIRGVQAGPVIRALVDRGLVRVTGRADLPGAPLQYATTKDFLDRFGLAGLKDLPRDGELAEG
jgi:segregation and condensation protein B